MKVIVRLEAVPVFLSELGSSIQDERRDEEKYARLATEARRVLPGALGEAIGGELSGISTQEGTHRKFLESAVGLIEQRTKTP